MSVKVETNGRRSVEVEFELPGTPEEVWAAIATGPGITSWFVTTKIEQQGGKPTRLSYDFGPEMNIHAAITAWEPPRLFAAEQEQAWGDAPKMATEWLVQARSGSVCSVRVVHSLFASTDDWDDQLQEAMNGWAGFLVNLRLYMTHFRGQTGALLRVKSVVAGPEAKAWADLTAAMGVQGLKAGQHWSAPEGAPPISGVVEHLTEDPYDALFILDKPLPGIAGLGANIYPDGSYVVAMHLYLYGDKAEEAVAYGTPLWQAWFDERFAAPVAAN
jgi:uncharacterized protein YndB with AHSA1/START domain